MADLSKIPLFRMVHIENIKHILSYGITHKESPHANLHFVPIGDSSIITTRNSFVLENGNTIGDYIPFYFASRTPMLYVIQNGFNGVKTNNPVLCNICPKNSRFMGRFYFYRWSCYRPFVISVF